jgi:hypothetical protein
MQKVMTENGRNRFMALVDWFCDAKESKDYESSDSLRKDLLKWQCLTGDQEFMRMHETGNYNIHPAFVSPEILNNPHYYLDGIPENVADLKAEILRLGVEIKRLKAENINLSRKLQDSWKSTGYLKKITNIVNAVNSDGD